MLELEGYRAEATNTRYYGEKAAYTWLKVTDPEGNTHDRFDPWPRAYVPQHYLRYAIGSVAKEQGKLELALSCFTLAGRYSRNAWDRKFYANACESVEQKGLKACTEDASSAPP